MMNDQQARTCVGQVDALLEGVEQIGDDSARDAALAAIQGLIDLYGEGLARVVSHVGAAPDGALSSGIVSAFAGDELVSHLLLLHGLHPNDVNDRVERALESIRPRLASHGGNVELVRVEHGVARVRLTGSCHGCAASELTLRAMVDEAVLSAAPELHAVQNDEAGDVTHSHSEACSTEAPALVPLLRAARAETEAPRAKQADVEQCELCSAIVPPEHQHLLETEARRLVCACRSCATLFSDGSIGGRHYRLIPDDVHRLSEIENADVFWAELAVPVDLAFFFYDSAANRTVAFYPSPMGATESQLSLEAWEQFTAANASVRALQPDVEALLVNRTKGRREHWTVPIDMCYNLAGVIRSHWKGLGGGDVVWQELDRFFDGLSARATTDDRRSAWATSR